MIRFATTLMVLIMGLQTAYPQDNSLITTPAPSSENAVSVESFIGSNACLTAEIDIAALDLTANQTFADR